MKGRIRKMWQRKGKPHGMMKYQQGSFSTKNSEQENGGSTSRNPDRVMDGGEKCPTGALVYHREGQTLPWPGLQRTRGMDAPALLPPSGLLVPPTTGSNQQGPRWQGASLLQSPGVSTGATKQGGRESKQELRRELRKRQKHGYEGRNGVNYFKAHFYLKKFQVYRDPQDSGTIDKEVAL